MKRTLYLLPAKGQPPLAIPATQPTRLVEVAEDIASSPAQGILLYFPQDNFTRGYDYPVFGTGLTSYQPVVLGDKLAHRRGAGTWVGLPKQMDQGGTTVLRPATVLFKATSANGTATTIAVLEFD